MTDKLFSFLELKIRMVFVFFLICFFSSSLLAQEKVENTSNPSPNNTQEVKVEENKFPPISETVLEQRTSLLPELKSKLERLQKQDKSDLFLIFNEKLFSNLLNELTQSKFNLGNLFEVKLVNPRMVFLNGLALAQLQADLTSTNSFISITTKLNITAKLLVEQTETNSLVAKFEIVDIRPAATGENTTTAAPTPSPEQLAKLLPPVTLPLELDFDRSLPADKYSQTKPVAYEISTEARRIRGHFQIIELLPLNGRLVLLAKVENLSITQGQGERKRKNKTPKPTPASFQTQTNLLDTKELDKQIDELSSNLTSQTDFSVMVKRHFLDLLVDEFAQASTRDVIIKLMRSRVMSSKSDLGFAKYENYLDIENGDGAMDLKDAELQSIKNGQIQLFVDASGQVQAQARGKQIGIEYQTSPQIGVSLRDQVAFTIEAVGSEFQLKPVAKKVNVHLDIKVPVQMIGRDINTSQNVAVDVASVIKPIVLPRVIGTNLTLPQATKTITLTSINYRADADKLVFGANLTFNDNK